MSAVELPSEAVARKRGPVTLRGSAQRIWRGVYGDTGGWMGALRCTAAVLLITLVWALILGVYFVLVVFAGVLWIPPWLVWKLVSRNARKRKLDEARHRELLDLYRRGQS